MAHIYVNIEDYIDEIETDTLLRELRTRKKGWSFEIKDIKDLIIDTTERQKFELLKELFGLQERHTKERLLEEVTEFLKYI
jgi:hypothetical protein